MTVESGAAETIAAVASPPGRGGVGVIRISGANVARIATAVLGDLPKARHARLGAFRDASGTVIDHGIALYFPGPASFTGEDVLELQGHGSPAVLDHLLDRVTSCGARVARPGEFSQRAFVNDKLDLAQAEAVADLIDAGTRAAAAAASRSLEGEFSRAVHGLADAMVELRVYVEAAIDFPDEDVDFLAEGDVAARLDRLAERLATLRERAARGAVLRDGLRLAIVGAPNVGKSSLLNALAQRDTAIVTDTPGTTRDVLREVVDLDGLPVHIADTAGLRETSNPVEQEGVERAHAEIASADCILLVVDDREGATDNDWARLPEAVHRPSVIVASNKCDLSGGPPGVTERGVRLSIATGSGLEELVGQLRAAAGLVSGEPEFTARRRHMRALDTATAALDAGRNQLQTSAAGDLLAEDLRAAHDALGTITGAYTSDDLLGEIFSSFCIGK